MKTLVKTLKQVLQKKSEIIDIILFGSAVKNKLEHGDIDVAVLAESEVNRGALKKELQTKIGKPVDVQILSLHDYAHFIWIALIREGFSIKHNMYLHKIYRIQPVVLYTYSLKKLTMSKKVMFERAIKNFKNIKKLSNRVILVPIEHSGEFSDFLKYWNIDFDSQEYGLLPLVRKEI